MITLQTTPLFGQHHSHRNKMMVRSHFCQSVCLEALTLMWTFSLYASWIPPMCNGVKNLSQCTMVWKLQSVYLKRWRCCGQHIYVNLPMSNGVKSDDVTLPSSNFVFFEVKLKLKKKSMILRGGSHWSRVSPLPHRSSGCHSPTTLPPPHTLPLPHSPYCARTYKLQLLC